METASQGNIRPPGSRRPSTSPRRGMTYAVGISPGKRKFVVTTDSQHDLPVYPNLAREMTLTSLDQLWVADITFLRQLSDSLLRDFPGGRARGNWCIFPQVVPHAHDNYSLHAPGRLVRGSATRRPDALHKNVRPHVPFSSLGIPRDPSNAPDSYSDQLTSHRRPDLSF